jgi:succinate dehydrogenase/fumarate reductase flavoprotein subunit
VTDILIVGAGGAGLSAALAAQETGASVKVITKSYPTRAQTCMAQGGINAALGIQDSPKYHMDDTLKAACGIADPVAVQSLCEEGIEAVRWLDRVGVPFSRQEDGNIAQRGLGGAQVKRACYAKDYTGLKILHTLYDCCNAEEIEILNERFLLELIVCDGRAVGAVVLNIKTGETETYYAKSVILATGGFGGLYGKYATNATNTTADGIAAAWRAGARLSNMEFIQFHPTSLAKSSVLISESARGEGGYLVNAFKERFTDELAPRDKVSRAIYEELQKSGAVYLDIRHLGEAFIEEALPQERKLAKLYEGVDPASELVPIKPAAHYTMGGIEVDDKTQSSIEGLFAVGECADHRVHGANRLGGNSLLELVVFGKRAGKNAAAYAANNMLTCSKKECQEDILSRFTGHDKVGFYEQKEHLSEIFYKKVGIKREAKGLQDALEFVKALQAKLPKMGIKDTNKVYNTELVEFLEFGNLLAVAEPVVRAALAREESRGAHFREDMPLSKEEYQARSIFVAGETLFVKDGVKQ